MPAVICARKAAAASRENYMAAPIRSKNTNLRENEMLNKLEGFLLNKFAGKLIARGVVILSSLIVGKAASAKIHLDPLEVAGALTLAGNAAFEWFKARRMANPMSPAVQTDVAKAPTDESKGTN